MSKKLTAAALAALMLLGMTGCSSGSNVTRDANRFFGTETHNTDGYSVGDNTNDYGSGNSANGYGTGNSANGYGTGNSASGYGTGNNTNGYGSGDNTDDRYREMVENGRVHDSDGYLLDGENRHD